MTTDGTSTADEFLAGHVERVTFHSPDSGFGVLQVHARGHRELVTVVGHATALTWAARRIGLAAQNRQRKRNSNNPLSADDVVLDEPPWRPKPLPAACVGCAWPHAWPHNPQPRGQQGTGQCIPPASTWWRHTTRWSSSRGSYEATPHQLEHLVKTAVQAGVSEIAGWAPSALWRKSPDGGT